jgi:hypothetical protein
MDRNSFLEVYALAQEWAGRTDKAMLSEYSRLGIGYANKLEPSIKSQVLQGEAGRINIETSFLIYGRFVDMGAGPGQARLATARKTAKLENAANNRARARGKPQDGPQGRKPKKFYSPIFYGRLNALMGVVSGSMVEQAIELTQRADPDAPTK